MNDINMVMRKQEIKVVTMTEIVGKTPELVCKGKLILINLNRY